MKCIFASKKKPLFSIKLSNITITAANIDQVLNQHALCQDWEAALLDVLREWFGSSDFIAFETSGSTGVPKKIKFTRKQVQASALLTAETFGLHKRGKILLCLHPKYVAGKMMVLRAIVNGWDLHVVEPSKSPEIQTQYHFSAMVPMQIESLIENNSTGLENIDQIIIGGAPISEKLMRKILHISPTCFATYGMTETLTHVAIQQLNKQERKSFFSALNGIELNQDSRGCINIGASHLSKDKIQTNDVVRFLDFGKFIWLGRHDHVINSGGVKIHPEQVEKKLFKLIERRLFVHGEEDAVLGQKVVLYIEGNPFDRITLDLLKEHLKNTLPRFEVPKVIVFVPKMEETLSKKLVRKTYL